MDKGSTPFTSTNFMIKSVYSFGCSYSCWRQDFYTGFADIVAQHFNVPLQNLSLPGNSNEEIIFEFNKRFFSNEFNDSLILLQTTHLVRTAYWDKGIDDVVSIQLSKNVVNGIENIFTKSNDNLKRKDNITTFNKQDFYTDYFFNLHDDLFEYKKLFYYLNHIQSSVKNTNNKIVFLHFDDFTLESPLISNLNFFKPDGETSSLIWAQKNRLAYSETDYHLSEYGNKVYAEKLLDFINRDQNKE